jgi:hypothetical protein
MAFIDKGYQMTDVMLKAGMAHGPATSGSASSTRIIAMMRTFVSWALLLGEYLAACATTTRRPMTGS